jgi:hypothetical protein
MPDDNVPQFFTPNAKGESASVYKAVIGHLESLQTSEIKARNRQFAASPVNTLMLDGIPGVPFERGSPNPDTFYQGEDIVYDLYLIHDGAPVEMNNYEISAVLKPSPRAQRITWQGTHDDGVYEVAGQPGYYELWIPSKSTEQFVAGTYYLQVQIKEKLAAGQGRFDRRFVLLQTYLNIDYSNFSTNPASRTNDARQGVEPIWPNSPNTIGTPRLSTDDQSFTME